MVDQDFGPMLAQFVRENPGFSFTFNWWQDINSLRVVIRENDGGMRITKIIPVIDCESVVCDPIRVEIERAIEAIKRLSSAQIHQ